MAFSSNIHSNSYMFHFGRFCGRRSLGGLNIPCICVCVCVCVCVHARAVPFCMTPRSDEIARLAPTNAGRDLAIRLMYLGRGRQIPFRQSTHSHIVKHSTHTHTHTHVLPLSLSVCLLSCTFFSLRLLSFSSCMFLYVF